MSNLSIHLPASRASFSDGYKLSVFQLWYRLGKCPARKLYDNVEDDPITKDRPSLNTLQAWIKAEFAERAEILDKQVELEIQGRLVEEKVAMLERHTKTATRMQEMANDYLEAHAEDLKIPNAVRLLVEGIRIESESRGIPQVLRKMINKSDEELMKDLQAIVANSTLTIEPNEDEE